VIVPLISLLGFFVISLAVFHQAKLRLPVISEKKRNR
jgi:hypothetical protein